MKLKDKLEWAKRAFEEIAQECEEISRLELVTLDLGEQRAWKAIVRKCRRNMRILSQA